MTFAPGFVESGMRSFRVEGKARAINHFPQWRNVFTMWYFVCKFIEYAG